MNFKKLSKLNVYNRQTAKEKIQGGNLLIWAQVWLEEDKESTLLL